MTDLDDLYADQAEDHLCQEEETADRFATAAAHLLWFNGEPGGLQPGTYTHRLLEAWAFADDVHHALLAKVYKPYAWAVERARAGEYDLLRHTVNRANEQAA